MHAMHDATAHRVGEEAQRVSEPDAPPDDELCWARLRKGDQAAFREIFGRHHKAVYNFAFRHCASWAVAEDTTQAAFVAVWRRAREGSLPRLSGGGVRAWLMGVARNQCRTAYRSSVRQLRVADRVSGHTSEQHDNVGSWLDHESGMSQAELTEAGWRGAALLEPSKVWTSGDSREFALGWWLPSGVTPAELHVDFEFTPVVVRLP